jgi:hypothetical protein
MTNKKVSLFSGIEFDVVEELGLNEACDFIVSLSSEHNRSLPLPPKSVTG